MQTWWWLALGAVILLALTATLVDGTGRLSRRRAGASAVRVPRPGEIWWVMTAADEPSHGRAGPASGGEPEHGEAPGAVWPGLVLAVGGDAADARVAPLSSAPEGPRRPGAVRLPPGTFGDGPCWLEAAELRGVPRRDLRQRAGTVAPAVWEDVRHLAG